jgi:hypothetical protein
VSSAQPGETPGPLNVRGKVTTVGPDAEIRSKGPLTAEGATTALTTLTIGTGTGAVTLTPQAGTINSLLLNGQILSAHDARYVFANDMVGTGTLTSEAAQDVGLPRWPMAASGTSRVKWVWEVPAEWDTVAVRFGWNKEAAGTGNVVWQFSYVLVYPFVTADVDAAAVTDVAVGAKAVSGTTFGFQYEIPSNLSALAIADGFLGSKPFMQCALSRLADDGADTYAGAAAVSLATMTRTT